MNIRLCFKVTGGVRFTYVVVVAGFQGVLRDWLVLAYKEEGRLGCCQPYFVVSSANRKTVFESMATLAAMTQ